MARKKTQRPRRLAPPEGADPALLATDLERWAGERVARGGRETALLGRVQSLRLGADGRHLEARVRDAGPAPYVVEVEVVGGLLASRCTCPFDWGPVCKHAVAAVEALRFPRIAPPILAGGKRAPRRGGRTARGRGRIVTPAPLPEGTLLPGGGEWTPSRDDRIAEARATGRLVGRIGRAIGFDVPGIGVRQLDRDRRMMPAGSRLDLGSQIQQRMHEEYVIGLLKP